MAGLETSHRTFYAQAFETTVFQLPLNCPTPPQYGYDDEFMRAEIMTLTTAAQNENPQLCFNNQLPTMKLYKVTSVDCSDHYNDTTCVGYTAYDTKRKAIVMSFKGAHGDDQMKAIMEGIQKDGIQSVFSTTNGKVFKTIYDSFMLIWNGGMSQDVRHLKYKYPSYELWVNGHSLGAMLAYVASAYLVDIALYKPDDMKVVVMGASRIGDYNFAVWHTATFSYNFHIVHRDDPIPRSITVDPKTLTPLFYPRTEVWYDNYMNAGDPYQICPESDGQYCSNLDKNKLITDDHLYYFNIDLPAWGHAGCPDNITAYAQQ
uniref:Lipase_3 domain-containing protein n=1 Tax=Caenorhabditis japonica TaxID=281687 RepID=A0A8R1HK67_CAEJA